MDLDLIASIKLELRNIPVNGSTVLQAEKGKLFQLVNLGHTGPITVWYTDGISFVPMVKDTCPTGGSWLDLNLFARNEVYISVSNDSLSPVNIVFEYATKGSIREVA